MKIMVTLTAVIMVSLNPMVASADYNPYTDSSKAEPKSFWNRVNDAVLPGLQRPSKNSYGNTYAPTSDNTSSFYGTFSDGDSRLYSTESYSPFKADPHTPSGNLFNFRF